MSEGEMVFLTLVLTAFATFIACMGFISIWSRRPPKVARPASDAITTNLSTPTYRQAA